MNILGSLEKIATADEYILSSIPINSSSKNAILNFFRSSFSLEEEIEVRNDRMPQSNQKLSIITPSQSTQCDRTYNCNGQYTDDGDQSNAYPNIPNVRTSFSSASMTSFHTNPPMQTSGFFSARTRVYNTATQAVHPMHQHQSTVQSMQDQFENGEEGPTNNFSAYRYQGNTM